jgi:antitoxin component YwqK of YwqJK toxin-antitoxin module
MDLIELCLDVIIANGALPQLVAVCKNTDGIIERLHRKLGKKDQVKYLGKYKYYFHANCAALKYECEYADGKRHGARRMWYKDGTLASEFHYIDDVLHGLARTWHEDGTLEFECNYVDGQPDGDVRAWHKNGVLRSKFSCSAGKKNGSRLQWYESGKLESKFEYHDDILHGECKWYRTDGSLRVMKIYREGEMLEEEKFAR